MNYDLFLSDFDGTLVRADGTVSEKNIQAIAEYRKKGGVFAVVTGRMLSSILPRLKELGLEEGLVVAYQGATIADVKTGKLLKNDGFPQTDCIKAIRILEREGYHIQVYGLHDFYCNMDDEPLKIYENICGVKGIVVEDELLSEKVLRENLRVIKVLAMVAKEDRDAVCEKLASELGEGYFVTTSSDYLVEIVPAHISKGNAVRFLADYYHIPLERVAAIGDQLNDLPMLQAAGGKFAVANAVEALKKSAAVVPSVEKDGVAVAIGKYAMGDNL